jgi:tRNA(adenine34) deaminase
MDDATAMRRTIELAREAHARGEQPFASLVLLDGQVVGQGWNTVASSHDVSAHAEIVALRDATARLGRSDLSDCTLFASYEPCVMCGCAIRAARVGRVLFGIPNDRFGSYSSRFNVLTDAALARFGPVPQVTAGYLEPEARRALIDVGWRFVD